MALSPLVIRNATSAALTLSQVERFESPPIAVSRSYISYFYSQPTSPTAAELSANAESFHSQDVSVAIAPFETVKTSILPPAPSSENAGTIRLTFSTPSGQRYRLSLPAPLSRSTVLQPLIQSPLHEFSAFYHLETSHLALFSSANLSSWMKSLNDETPLAALSIPGTHNSPTHHHAMPSVRCQAVPVKEQLHNGVRFLDVRVQPEHHHEADSGDDKLAQQIPTKPDLHLVHAAFGVAIFGPKYFKDLIDDVLEFLNANPSEVILISVKREGTGNATDELLSRIMHEHYASPGSKWFTEPRLPTLKEVRGRVVLLRRFRLDEGLHKEVGDAGWGIDCTEWADNTPCALNSTGQLCIQDFYQVMETENIDEKITYAEKQLANAAKEVHSLDGAIYPQEKAPPLYIKFVSASSGWDRNCWPEKIAAKLNPSIVNYLCSKHAVPSEGQAVGDGSTGVVICDWVGNNGDWDLVKCIVGMNAKLEVKQAD